MKQRYTIAQIREALVNQSGFMLHAAQELGCDRQTIANYVARYPELKEVLKGEREKQLDNTELQLLRAINDREPWAIMLHLTTVGKDRGYVKRVEQTGRDGGPVQSEISGPEGGPIEVMPVRERLVARLTHMAARVEAHAIPRLSSGDAPDGDTERPVA